MNVDDEWENFLEGGDDIVSEDSNQDISYSPTDKCEELYISTKTKVLYLNQEIDITPVFWEIPVISYSLPENGIIKKQIKLIFNTPEDYEHYKERLKSIPYYTEHQLKHIDNPESRKIKFKDERKITIGISKKDIMNCRGKVKNAFYNCFYSTSSYFIDNSFVQ